MSYRWRRHPDEQLATDELLDAAGRAFAELGVAKATMVDVARHAGCSRATLYRYFPNQEAVHLGFVHRATLRIATQLADSSGPDDAAALTNRVLAGIAAVRSDPQLSVWFEPENMSVPMRVAQSSELLHAMSVGSVDQNETTTRERAEIERRGEWLLRSIVSLLAMPGKDAAAERTMIESFVVPVVISEFDETQNDETQIEQTRSHQ